MTNEIAKFDTLTPQQAFKSPATLERFKSVLDGSESQFVASLLSIINNNSYLAQVTNTSIMNAAMKAATLKLPIEPSLGFAYIVPYKRQAQFQIGYKGLIQLAQRSGKYKSINSGVVYKSQFISYNPLFEELEIDFTQPQDEVIGYFAAFKLLNGFEKVTYWTKEQAYAHGKRFSKSFNDGPWKSDFDAMAQKTLLKQIISKYGPLSIEMEQAIVADNETENGKAAPIDVTPQETESLDDVLGNSTVSKVESVENPQAAAEEPQNKVAVSKTETTTPKVDEETGEVLDGEQGELFKELEDLM